MVIAIMLMLLGFLGPAATVMWREGKWRSSALWLRRNVSPGAEAAAPVAGALVASVGLMLVWPPAVVFAFLSAFGLLYVMAAAARARSSTR